MVYYIHDKIVSEGIYIEYLEEAIRKISRSLDHHPIEDEEGKKVLRETIGVVRQCRAKRDPKGAPFY